MKNSLYFGAVVFLAVLTGSGCSLSHLLVGDISPVDEKADRIVIPSLESFDQNWKRIETGKQETSTQMPDRAWQSVKTASVISFNSVCRGKNPEEDKSLKEITADMLSQWEILNDVSEKDISISGFTALETTAEGLYFSKKRKFQTVVVKTPSCIYDLIYLGSPKSFTQDLGLFQKFRDKLILK